MPSLVLHNTTGHRHPPADHVDFTPVSRSRTRPGLYLYRHHSVPPSPVTWTCDRFLSGLHSHCATIQFTGFFEKMILEKHRFDGFTAHSLHLPHPQIFQWLPTEMRTSRKCFHLASVYVVPPGSGPCRPATTPCPNSSPAFPKASATNARGMSERNLYNGSIVVQNSPKPLTLFGCFKFRFSAENTTVQSSVGTCVSITVSLQAWELQNWNFQVKGVCRGHSSRFRPPASYLSSSAWGIARAITLGGR